MTQLTRVSVNFTRPHTWYGKLICLYQLISGVKFWQYSHCNILTDTGCYAYNIDEAYTNEPIPGEEIGTVLFIDVDLVKLDIRHALFIRCNGHFTPLSIINGRHCVGHVAYCLNLHDAPRLPGQLFDYILRGKYELYNRKP